ncbi:hypothetical protein NMY22_g13273 [Coprinellus aureogranulatus]|nr:hypothetical protein NMY22_g13273 [Coprinellus aureogranulatus]
MIPVTVLGGVRSISLTTALDYYFALEFNLDSNEIRWQPPKLAPATVPLSFASPYISADEVSTMMTRSRVSTRSRSLGGTDNTATKASASAEQRVFDNYELTAMILQHLNPRLVADSQPERSFLKPQPPQFPAKSRAFFASLATVNRTFFHASIAIFWEATTGLVPLFGYVLSADRNRDGGIILPTNGHGLLSILQRSNFSLWVKRALNAINPGWLACLLNSKDRPNILFPGLHRLDTDFSDPVSLFVTSNATSCVHELFLFIRDRSSEGYENAQALVANLSQNATQLKHLNLVHPVTLGIVAGVSRILSLTSLGITIASNVEQLQLAYLAQLPSLRELRIRQKVDSNDRTLASTFPGVISFKGVAEQPSNMTLKILCVQGNGTMQYVVAAALLPEGLDRLVMDWWPSTRAACRVTLLAGSAYGAIHDRTCKRSPALTETPFSTPSPPPILEQLIAAGVATKGLTPHIRRPNSSRRRVFWRGPTETHIFPGREGCARAENVGRGSHPYRLKTLCDVANALSNTGSVGDVHEAIPLYREVLEHRPQGDPEHAITLYDLATALSKSGSVRYLHEAIPLYRQALGFRPQGDPERDATVDGLANALSKAASISDPEESVTLRREALDLRPPGHQERHATLDALANAVFKRGSVGDLQESITLYREVLDLVSPGHPDRMSTLDNLANALFKAGSIRDLGEMTQLYREVLELCPPGDPQRDSALANLVSLPSKMDVDDDLQESVRVLRAALDLVPPGFPERDDLLHWLGYALILIGSPDDSDIQEGIRLNREALELRPSGHPKRDTTLHNLAGALSDTGSPDDLQESIRLYREALGLRPPGHPARHYSLAGLASTLDETGSPNDLQESIQLYQEALELRPPGHPKCDVTLNNLALALSKTGSPDDLEESIRHHREALELEPPGHQHRASSLRNLARALEKRGSPSDLEEAKRLCEEAQAIRSSR